jgi:hypothetical protein
MVPAVQNMRQLTENEQITKLYGYSFSIKSAIVSSGKEDLAE